jgi:hypothetical protein
MAKMKNLSETFIIIFATLLLLTSCKKKEALEQTDNLQQTGILGLWKLDSREINGVLGLAVECCDYIEFITDGEPTDLKGEFKAFGAGYETNGIFELDNTAETVEFTYGDKQLLYDIQISDYTIVFSYSDDDDSIVEHWRKEILLRPHSN